MKNKQGITMVVLVATVVIAVAIMSVSVIAIRNSIKNAEITAITEEFTTIQKAVEEYYFLNGELPYLETTKYGLADLSSITSDAGKLNEEIALNNESSSTYYIKIDLNKINIENSVRGNARVIEGGGSVTPASDVYIVAYPSLNVYYLAGVQIEGEYYFSLAKLNKTTTVTAEQNEEEYEEFISGDLSVKKKKKTWTNNMNIEITTFMASNNSLYVSIPNGSGGKIVKNVVLDYNKTSIIALDDLTDVGFSSSESQLFKNLAQSSKKVTITKKENNNVVGKVEVDLSNYETIVPTVGDTIVRESYPEYNTFTLEINDNESGVDVLKYEYYEKRGVSGNNVVLEDSQMYEKDYIIKNGKEVKIKDNKITVKIPKNIVTVKYVALDRAGNSTNILTLDTKYPVFIGYSTVSGTKNSLTFNVSVESSSTVDSVKTYLSKDGQNFASEYNHGSVSVINNFTYLDIDNMKDYIFVKVVAQTGGITESRIIQVDVSGFVNEGTNTKSQVSWSNPYIPNGFVHIEGTVLTGYVIQDISNTSNKYNEFVWIPVDYIYNNTTLAKGTDSTKTKLENLLTGFSYGATSSTVDTLPSGIISNYNISVENDEYSALVESVARYGGFYVARYEAGDFSAVEPRSSTSNVTNKVVSKKGAYVYNYVGWNDDAEPTTNMETQSGGAVSLARNMYVDSIDIKSCLMYGCQYDAIMHFINLSSVNVSDSTDYGNYTDSLIKTGSNEANKVLNIYDLAGNVFEWTMEVKDSTTRVIRGGAITFDGSLNPVSYRGSSVPNTVSNTVGFRPVLYIK